MVGDNGIRGELSGEQVRVDGNVLWFDSLRYGCIEPAPHANQVSGSDVLFERGIAARCSAVTSSGRDEVLVAEDRILAEERFGCRVIFHNALL